MTGSAKGRLALVALGIVALGLGAAIATRPRFRALWLARGLSSRDGKTRRGARLALLALGRPTVDPSLARIIVDDLRERVDPDSTFFVGPGEVHYSEGGDGLRMIHLLRDAHGRPVDLSAEEYLPSDHVVVDDAVVKMLDGLVRGQLRLVAVRTRELDLGGTRAKVLDVTTSPLDPELEPAVLELLRAGGPP